LYKSKTVKSDGTDTRLGDTFTFRAAPDSAVIFKVKEHKSLGRDQDLAQGVVPLTNAGEQTIPLGDGQGAMVVAVEYNT
jgi:hypothetical protein